MKRRKRIYYTDTQKELMWHRRQQSESLHQIAPLFDRHHSSVRTIPAEHGSIRPPVRQGLQGLSLAEHEEISRGLVAGRSIRMIAALIGGRITDTASISEQPADAEDRAVLGHWEGCLLFGDRNSQIATPVERKTRYLMLVKVAGKVTETVVNADQVSTRQPKKMYRSLT